MPNRRALCIGIDDYPAAHSLSGCVNDAGSWAEVLRDVFDYADDIETLRNKSATRHGIVTATERLLAGLGRGDTAAITVSCHGSYTVVDDLARPALCPYDVEADWLELAQLRDLANTAATGVRLTLLLDCGFSGTSTRVALGDDAIRRPDDRRVRYLSPSVMGRPLVDDVRSQLAFPSDWRHVVMTASRENQYALETFSDGEHRGVFSRSATATLRKAAKPLTPRKLHDVVSRVLSDESFDQEPRLIGPAAALARPVFA